MDERAWGANVVMSRIDQRQLEHFQKEGYVVVEDLIDPETFLDPLVAEYERRLDELAASCSGKDWSIPPTRAWSSVTG